MFKKNVASKKAEEDSGKVMINGQAVEVDTKIKMIQNVNLIFIIKV